MTDPELPAIKKRLSTLLAESPQTKTLRVNLSATAQRVQSYQNALAALRTHILKRPDFDKNPGDFMDWAAERWHLARAAVYSNPIYNDIRPGHRKEIINVTRA